MSIQIRPSRDPGWENTFYGQFFEAGVSHNLDFIDNCGKISKDLDKNCRFKDKRNLIRQIRRFSRKIKIGYTIY